MKKLSYLFLLLFTFVGGVTKLYAEIGAPLPKDGWTISGSSWCWDGAENSNGSFDRIIDGKKETYWHSNWKGDNGTGTGGSLPEWFVVDLQSNQEIGGVIYTPRQEINGNTNGACKAYKVYVSDSPFTITDKNSVSSLTDWVAEGTFEYTTAPKTVVFDKKQQARYVMFVITDSHGSVTGKWATCAEFDVCKYASNLVDITYNIYENDTKVITETHQVGVGAAYPALQTKLPAFFTSVAGSTKPEGQVTQAETYDIKYTTTVTGTDYANAPEVTCKVNGKYAKTQGDETQLVSTLADVNEYKWKIVGNLKTGYKLYNVASGESKTLTLVETGNNKPATMTADTNNNTWIFTAGNSSNSSALHLQNTTMYLGDHTNNNELSTWNSANGANATQSQWVINKPASVTYEYYIDNSKVATKTVVQAIGTPIAEPLALSYATVTYPNGTGTVTENTGTVRVNVVENLPFKKTTDLSAPTWYAIDIRSTDNANLWHFENVDAAVKTKTPGAKYADAGVLSDDAYFWCLKGDIVNGFTIYNKKAGTANNQTLNYTSESAKVTVMEQPTSWRIIDNGSVIKDGFCLTADGGQYLNYQDATLKYWNGKDVGSTCRLHAPASFAIQCMKENAEATNVPDNAVGSYINIHEADKQLTAAEKDTLNFATAKALADKLKELYVDFEEGAYYRIVNAFPKFEELQKVKKCMLAVAGNNSIQWDTLNPTDVNNVFCLEKKSNGKFCLKNMNREQYMQGVAGALGNKESAQDMDFVSLGLAQFNLKYANGTCHANSHNNGSGPTGNLITYPGTQNSASAWYIIKATDIEVALNAHEGKSYATAYLPFDIASVEGAKAYIGQKNETGNKLNATVLEGGIPAKHGVILMSETAEPKATLKLGQASATVTNTVTNNALTGTLTEKDYTDELVFGLGNTSGKVGFYKMAAGAKILANKAYLAAGAKQALELVFEDGTTTGIENVTNEAAKRQAPIYDLTGRRIMQTVKGGLYIQNGKKFIAQ